MDAYRTPDERFADLPGFPYRPHYRRWEGMRLAHIDEGAGRPLLLLHGEPDWSYLYRKMIPVLVGAGHRVVAPDYPGFGRSDKPTEIGWYTYDRFTDSVRTLVEELDLRDITVVVQDWGGPIGLRVAVEARERFSRLVVMDTGLFGGGRGWPTPGFMAWRGFAERVGLDLPVGRIMQGSVVNPLPDAVLAAYDAPFPTRESKAGAAAFPLLVPLSAEGEVAGRMRAVAAALREWDVPSLVLWGTSDPVFPPEAGEAMARLLPGCHGVELIEGAGHMVQEDRGEEIAERMVAWLAGG